VARFKGTDLISGMQVEGLTSDLSDGGCCILTRRAPFSPGTQILLEVTKDGVSLRANATVIYNLKEQVMGVRFDEMSPEHAAVLAGWMKARMPLAQ
jgi:PilZ domain